MVGPGKNRDCFGRAVKSFIFLGGAAFCRVCSKIKSFAMYEELSF